MVDTGFPRAPTDASDWKQGFRTLAGIINSLRDGKINARGSVTLTENTTTTTLTDARIGPNSVIPLMATTANAAGALATTYVSARTKGSATITHANNAQTDRTFGYAVLG